LFSRDDVAAFVNRNFEPVWESVRPVPTLKLDFGNGTVLTRTLHGNIASYVCTAAGEVLDALPGIYTPPEYLKQLNQFRLLANFVDQQGPEKRAARLREYHEDRLEARKKQAAPPQFFNLADFSKGRIECGLKAMLVKGGAVAPPAQPGATPARPDLDKKEDLASWELLAKDTQLNETVRRQQIDEMILAAGLVTPDKLTRKLYKDVLHADLDDPYLGLGKVLFEGYVFTKEDEHR